MEAAAGILAKLAAFGAVCIPLGLWYPVRNLILFGQPLGYVAPHREDAAIYCGNEALADRFVPLLSRIGRKAFTVTPLRIIIFCVCNQMLRVQRDRSVRQRGGGCCLAGLRFYPDNRSPDRHGLLCAGAGQK